MSLGAISTLNMDNNKVSAASPINSDMVMPVFMQKNQNNRKHCRSTEDYSKWTIKYIRLKTSILYMHVISYMCALTICKFIDSMFLQYYMYVQFYTVLKL